MRFEYKLETLKSVTDTDHIIPETIETVTDNDRFFWMRIESYYFIDEVANEIIYRDMEGSLYETHLSISNYLEQI